MTKTPSGLLKLRTDQRMTQSLSTCTVVDTTVKLLQLKLKVCLPSTAWLNHQREKKLSVLFLDYSLASYGNELLTQLHELTATYTRLAKEGNTDFRFIGDSAGGHLSTTFTQYLYKEQNPELPYLDH